MRFASLRNGHAEGAPPSSTADRLILMAYNLVWWLPVVLPVLGLVSYTVGLVAFLIITVVRAMVNLYRNNLMPVERAQHFPLRLP
jgi:hypothetical protein